MSLTDSVAWTTGVREEGREHEKEREQGPGSIKGEENNTLLTAEIRGFL